MTRQSALGSSRRRLHLYPLGLLCSVTVLVTTLAVGAHAGDAASRTAAPVRDVPALTTYGSPAQTGPAGVDSATSFNATLPNGRRVTPAGVNVQVGENPLNSVLSPDGQYLFVTNNDERSGGVSNTSVSGAGQNGAGKTVGGFTLSVVRTSDMQVVSSTVAPANVLPHPSATGPGRAQSDATNGLFLGLAVKGGATPGTYTLYAAGGRSDQVDVYAVSAAGVLNLTTSIAVPVPTDKTKPSYGVATPGGMTLTPDGSRLYVVDNTANTVIAIDTASNTVVPNSTVPVGYYPYAPNLSPDGTKLYVSNWGVADRNFNSTYQASSSTSAAGVVTGTGSPNIGGVAGNLFANPVTDPARTSSVSVINLASNSVATSVSLARPIDGYNVVGGTHPSAMASISSNGRTYLYVANANDDSIGIVDGDNGVLLRRLYLPAPTPELQAGKVAALGLVRNPVQGLQPNAVAIAPNNQRMYVAEAGLNAIDVYSLAIPFLPIFLGRIPTGWYPTSVTVSPDGASLYVTNAKGLGSDYQYQGQLFKQQTPQSASTRPVPASPADVNLLFGTAQKIDLTSLDLNASSTQVQNDAYQALPSSAASTIQAVAPNIQHVIYILRENKTYDSYFGNDAVLNARGANGSTAAGLDPSVYAPWSPYVPNSQALAEQFNVGDNFYADSEESNAGHFFALGATSTDFQQKTLLSRFTVPFLNTKNEDPEDLPLTGFLFQNAARGGVSYRDYGDLIRVSGYDDGQAINPCQDDPGFPNCSPSTYSYTNTTASTVGFGGLYSTDVPSQLALGGHVDPNYPGWSLRISDQRRAKEFISDYGAMIANGTAPQFTFIWLPADHTGSVPSQSIDPRFQVSDGDAALGQIVDFVSHSSIWPSTAMFVTEDDAQSTPDHVNAHRTFVQVISPYAKRNYVSHQFGSTVSVPKTIEELLGLSPMNLNDLLANDLSDYFTTTPNLTPYTMQRQATFAPITANGVQILSQATKLDTTTYDKDNKRLGMIDKLFLDSQALVKKQTKLLPMMYQMQQARLDRIAQEIASNNFAFLRDPDGF